MSEPAAQDRERRRNAETWAVAQPWLDLGATWQAILDRELPTSLMGRRAREALHYIDTQLARLSGRCDRQARSAQVHDALSDCPFCGWSDLEDWQATMLHEAHDKLEALALAEPGSAEFADRLAEARRFVGVA